MHGVTLLWAGIAGTAVTLAGAHGLLWLLDRRGRANLAFCAVAIGVAGLAVTELGMMHSASPAEYGEWVRWFHVPNFLTVAGLVLFVHLQFGSGRVWLAGMVVGLRGALLLANFIVHPNVNWSEISGLRTLPFLGEQVSVIGAAVVRQPVQWAASLASLLFIVYVADALIRAWRRGDRETRRKALVICGGILAFITLATVESQLVVWGVVRMPVVVAPPFLILVAAIAYELGRGLVASARVEREAQRLREELAHAARVNAISGLSGSLAHELRQPLTAIMANAQAAQIMLDTDRPDLAELRAILADICADDRRADAIIERTRAFLKRTTIELQDLSVCTAVRDVLALVRTDAITRGVTLEAVLSDAIPRVRADRVQLSQVLINLLINAMESVSARPQAERNVRVEARPRDERLVEVSVVDSGAGVPEAILPRIFDGFVTTKPAGLGIGLAVSKAIVEAHGGELSAENNPQRGATFRFTLRAATP
jgi:C4-dicarboxylate-specific signal transduction histidine kinase